MTYMGKQSISYLPIKTVILVLFSIGWVSGPPSDEIHEINDSIFVILVFEEVECMNMIKLSEPCFTHLYCNVFAIPSTFQIRLIIIQNPCLVAMSEKESLWRIWILKASISIWRCFPWFSRIWNKKKRIMHLLWETDEAI